MRRGDRSSGGCAAKRHRKRMVCDIRAEGRTQRSVVLDVSRSGLFVQTAAHLAPGTLVDVEIQLPDGEVLRLRTRVARQKSVPSQLTSVAQGGVGLRILDAPPAYYAAVSETAPARVAAPPPPAASPPEARFRVRVKQSDGPRSRILDIRAASAQRAKELALSELGSGWEIVEAQAG